MVVVAILDGATNSQGHPYIVLGFANTFPAGWLGGCPLEQGCHCSAHCVVEEGYANGHRMSRHVKENKARWLP